MKQLFFLTSIILLFCSACSNNDDEVSSPEGKKASLTISLTGKAGTTTRNVGPSNPYLENIIGYFTIYVFANNRLERVEKTSSTIPVTTLFVDELTTGVKRIVVIANSPYGYDDPFLSEGDPYSKLADVANYINLDDQTVAPGLVMTGETDATLQSITEGTNNITIPLSRIVAKIKLGSITIDPTAGVDPTLFQLTGIAIIKAKSQTSLGIPSIVTAQPFYSGIKGLTVQDSNNIKGYLYEPISLSDYSERYFYVFANDNSEEDATLMALEGTYNGVTMYYPFRLPAIARNTEHTINITLRRLGTGSPDPELPSDPTTLIVTITPADWVVVPTQNVDL